MSAFGGKADIASTDLDVRFRPKAEMTAGLLGHESHHISRSKNVILFRYLGVVFGTGEEP